MKKVYTQEEISQFFKSTFEGEKGEVVLEKIKEFCGGNNNQILARPESVNMTFFNLGANSVYRYIQTQIDMDLTETKKDCVEVEETGE